MTVLAMVLMTDSQHVDAELLDGGGIEIGGRQIDNPLANNLGFGTLVGQWVVGAQVLNNPAYDRWMLTLGTYPIHVMDTVTLFIPEED